MLWLSDINTGLAAPGPCYFDGQVQPGDTDQHQHQAAGK